MNSTSNADATDLENLIDRLRKHHQKYNKLAQAEPLDQSRMQAQQQKGEELKQILLTQHPADIATVLDALPEKARVQTWHWLDTNLCAAVFFALNSATRANLLEQLDTNTLISPLAQLDVNQIAVIAPQLPAQMLSAVQQGLSPTAREQLETLLAFEEHQLGGLIDFDHIALRGDVTVAAAMRYLRRFDQLPEHTDKLFITDHAGKFTGVLRLRRLVTSKPSKTLNELAETNVPAFTPQDEALKTAQAFERYDLFSAPVVDSQGHLLGRITVDNMLDVLRWHEEQTQLAEVGVKSEEDIFAPVTRSIKNRSPWLAINLVTALIAAQVIGLFEDSIAQLVVLAALMPIVAGMGGNVGNQSITMIVRELSSRALDRTDIAILYAKELKIGLFNGLIWGGILGIVIILLYQHPPLAAVIMAAMTLNFLSAAFFGVTIPVVRAKMGRDPALGSSVMITAITDSGGFFIFLGLATIFLL